MYGRKMIEKSHKAYRVKGNVLVFLKSNGTKLVGSMRQISLSGLSFHYIGRSEPLNDQGELAICSSNKDFCLYKLPCKILSDSKVYENHPSPISMRRCGVQFGELEKNQITEIEHFIENHTWGEV